VRITGVKKTAYFTNWSVLKRKKTLAAATVVRLK